MCEIASMNLHNVYNFFFHFLVVHFYLSSGLYFMVYILDWMFSGKKNPNLSLMAYPYRFMLMTLMFITLQSNKYSFSIALY